MDSSQCFNVPIFEDSLFESLEGFFLVLLPREDFIVAGVTNSSVFIIDNEGMSSTGIGYYSSYTINKNKKINLNEKRSCIWLPFEFEKGDVES